MVLVSHRRFSVRRNPSRRGSRPPAVLHSIIIIIIAIIIIIISISIISIIIIIIIIIAIIIAAAASSSSLSLRRQTPANEMITGGEGGPHRREAERR